VRQVVEVADQPPISTPPPKLAITSATPPSGGVGTSYAGSGFSLTASGGIAPYHWSWVAASGTSLPAGLNLSTSGLISGTPQVASTYDVTVTVSESSSSHWQVSADYQIAVAGTLVLTITSGAPANGTAGVDYGPTLTQYYQCYATGGGASAGGGGGSACTPCVHGVSCPFHQCLGFPRPYNLPCTHITRVFQGFTFTVAGGVPPYTWSSAGMPPGIYVDPSTGEILGTPTTAGSYSVVVTATDTASPPGQVSGTYAIDIQ
jgi:large repetitive protein